MNSVATPRPTPAWSFVRLTAWSMIVLGIIGLLMSLMQAFLAVFVFTDDVVQFMRESPELAHFPAWTMAMFSHLLHITLFVFAVSLLTILAGWGMLLRRRWALWFSVAMFWLGSAGNAFGIWLHALFLHNFRDYAQGLPEWSIRMIEANYWSAQISGAIFGLVFAVGFAWTAWKLGSASTRLEFDRPMT